MQTKNIYMTKHDAARKVIIFVLWVVIGMPPLIYMIEEDFEPYIPAIFAVVWILLVNVAAYYLAHWLYPVSHAVNMRSYAVGGSWLPTLRVILWITGVGDILLFGSMFLGFLTAESFLGFGKAVIRFFM